jgi:ribosomal-protein-alanine N-acetyltransferase
VAGLALGRVIAGRRVALRAPRPGDARELVDVMTRSWVHLRPWFPPERGWEKDVARCRDHIRETRRQWREDRAYRFLVVSRRSGRILGMVALSNLARGAFQSASLGYWLAEDATGRGHATAAARLAIATAFGPLGLHRVEAAVIPRNRASVAVLRRAGLRRIGRSPRYLCIDGRWQDHWLYARTVEDGPL